MVLAHRSSTELTALQQKQQHITIKTDADAAIIQRFAPTDKISGVLVRMGHILAVQQGGTPSEAFFARIEKEVKL